MSSPAFMKIRGDDIQSSRVQDGISNQLQPVASALAATPIMGAPPPPWIRPSLTATFANTGGAFALAGYHKDALGYVHSRGTLTNAAGTAAGTTIFTLMMGCRPQATQRFSVRGTAGAVQSVTVTAAGIVSNDIVIGAAGTIDLSFSFLAEQ